MAQTKSIQVICPICDTRGRVDVPRAKVEAKDTGTTSVLVPKDLMCEHSFYTYVDRNYAVRDYLVTDLMLFSEKDKYEQLKLQIQKEARQKGVTYAQISELISDRHLRNLLFAGFIGSPIMILTHDPEKADFKTLFSLLVLMFPHISNTFKIYLPTKYLDVEKTQEEILANTTVYNLAYKLMPRKPFSASEADPMQNIITFFKNQETRLNFVYAKNFLDILEIFYEEFQKLSPGLSDTELITELSGKNPKYASLLNNNWVQVLKRRSKFEKTIVAKI